MARQLLNKKKTLALRRQTGLDIIAVLVRGGGHDKLLCLRDGTITVLHTDGTSEQQMWTWNGVTTPMKHQCESVLDEK